MARRSTNRIARLLFGAASRVRAMLRAAYRGAERGRLTSDWAAKTSSADAALLPALALLLPRARDLVRNDPFARSAVRAFRRNVIGRGIWPSPAKLTADRKPDEAWNEQVNDLWDQWADDPTRCDRERKRTFPGIQRWAVGELVVVGECLVVMVEEIGPDGTGSLVLQCFEAEQLDRTITAFVHDGKTRQVRGGVEVDEYGAAVAYHLSPATMPDWGQTGTAPKAERIDASRVLHIFDAERARQTRGETRMASALLTMHNLAEFDSAHQVAARAEACIGWGIESEEGVGDDDATDSEGRKKDAKSTLEMSPFTVFRGRPGEKLIPYTPTRPGNAYEPYTKMQVRRIAAAIGLSYEMVARDWTGGSYSSLRQGMLEDRREFRELQDLVIAKLCTPVYRRKMEVDVLAGRLVPNAAQWARSPAQFQRCAWMPDGWDWIDPQNEAEAYAIGLDKGLITLDEIHSGRGRNWRDVLRQVGEERKYADEQGAAPRDDLPAKAEPDTKKGATGAGEAKP